VCSHVTWRAPDLVVELDATRRGMEKQQGPVDDCAAPRFPDSAESFSGLTSPSSRQDLPTSQFSSSSAPCQPQLDTFSCDLVAILQLISTSAVHFGHPHGSKVKRDQAFPVLGTILSTFGQNWVPRIELDQNPVMCPWITVRVDHCSCGSLFVWITVRVDHCSCGSLFVWITVRVDQDALGYNGSRTCRCTQ
jgi:hypothetical protein